MHVCVCVYVPIPCLCMCDSVCVPVCHAMRVFEALRSCGVATVRGTVDGPMQWTGLRLLLWLISVL